MLMDFQHGILFFVIGCTSTIIGFFIAFLVIHYNKRKEEEKIKRQNETKVHPYGDDTV
jgi:phosphotransferase system  glucose/maltose/N-acetylglucosamine-specific IIC component